MWFFTVGLASILTQNTKRKIIIWTNAVAIYAQPGRCHIFYTTIYRILATYYSTEYHARYPYRLIILLLSYLFERCVVRSKVSIKRYSVFSNDLTFQLLIRFNKKCRGFRHQDSDVTVTVTVLEFPCGQLKAKVLSLILIKGWMEMTFKMAFRVR